LKLKQQEVEEKAYSDRFLQIIPAEKLVKLTHAETDFRKLIPGRSSNDEGTKIVSVPSDLMAGNPRILICNF
jgi:hypothetical protein